MTVANNAHHFVDRTADYITCTQPLNVTDLLSTQLGNRASKAESDRSKEEPTEAKVATYLLLYSRHLKPSKEVGMVTRLLL